MNLKANRFKQQGLTLSGMLLWSVVLVLVAVLGMKLVPVYIENATIKKNLDAIANDASLQNANATHVRLAFSKRAQIDNITVIRENNLKITRDNGKNQLSVDYSVNVPLFANISLQIDFETKSN
ncbi:MAG: DUF4845 domain-containing protein [Burkholderiales bacterium]|nr:DUF4845 domain-containing protein [Burkholderiales bacterium]MDR4518088.1 DUF4845 domain-containing protein [Nitrosomonas sp.]